MQHKASGGKWRVLLLILIAICVTAAGCRSADGVKTARATSTLDPQLMEQDDPNHPPTPGGKIVVAVPSETSGWNPNVNEWGLSGQLVGSTILEPLALSNWNGIAEPYLLERWSASEDFKTWDLTLKQGITFTNGEKLDADLLRANFDYLAAEGRCKEGGCMDLVDRIEKVDAYTVRVKLKIQWVTFDITLTDRRIMPRAMMTNPEFRGAAHPIGTGPFMFSSWDRERSLVVKRNPNYWRHDGAGRRLPYLDEIEFEPIGDDAAKESALKTGDVDMALMPSASDVLNRFRYEPGYTALLDGDTDHTLVALNTAPSTSPDPAKPKFNPLSNLHARRAIAYGTDARALANRVAPGLKTDTQMFRPGSPWALLEGHTGYYPFDPDKARQEVEQYKADTGQRSLSFTLSSVPGAETTAVFQAMQDQLRTVGITVELDIQDEVPLKNLRSGAMLQSSLFQWSSKYPKSLFNLAHSSTNKPVGVPGKNVARYSTPTLDKNLEIGMFSGATIEERAAAARALTLELNQAAVFIWLYNTPSGLVAQHKVHGLNTFRAGQYGVADGSFLSWSAQVWLDHDN